MTYDVVLTRKAERQITATARWWAKHRSAQQAQRWYLGLVQTLTSLENDLQRCPLAPEHEVLPLPIRQITYGLGRKPTHRALFAIRGQNKRLFTRCDTSPNETSDQETSSQDDPSGRSYGSGSR